MAKRIRCSECEYARRDKAASVYSQKRCKGCGLDEDCTCGKKNCKCGNGCKLKNSDEICPKQILKWEAIQCGNFDSEYHRALLNVTPNGDMQDSVTWVGCAEGVIL